jgi:adenylate cyclase
VRGEGVAAETLARRPDGAPADELWLRSPPYHLVSHGQRRLRRRIDRASVAEFPILGDFAALGGRDYLAFRQPLGARVVLGDLNGVFLSWVTDREAAVGNAWIARALLETYLGRDAARRVLEGNIVRGRTETIRAVVWYSDLQGFTRLADTLPASEVLALLNEYVEPLVDAVTEEGGEVLKFVGDGVLAIFGGREPPDACAAALRAWERSRGAAEAISARRAARGAAVTRPYLALHDGEVLYGNFGAPARLDFTVLGPAVNEAARLAALSRSLDQPLIVSDAFAGTCGPARDRLVALGRFALRGVARPQMLWTLDPAGAG